MYKKDKYSCFFTVISNKKVFVSMVFLFLIAAGQIPYEYGV